MKVLLYKSKMLLIALCLMVFAHAETSLHDKVEKSFDKKFEKAGERMKANFEKKRKSFDKHVDALLKKSEKEQAEFLDDALKRQDEFAQKAKDDFIKKHKGFKEGVIKRLKEGEQWAKRKFSGRGEHWWYWIGGIGIIMFLLNLLFWVVIIIVLAVVLKKLIKYFKED